MLRPRFKDLSQRMRADAEKGVAAIEFAMVAPVFFMILMATIETGVIFFAHTTLQNALNDAARLVRTGQTACYSLDANNMCKPMTEDEFRAKVCSESGALLKNCGKDANGDSDLQFDVNAYPSGFTGVTNSSPLDANADLPKLSVFNVGNACDVVLVRAFYKWPIFTPGLSALLGNMHGPFHLLATAAAFRNEPYTTTTGGC